MLAMPVTSALMKAISSMLTWLTNVVIPLTIRLRLIARSPSGLNVLRPMVDTPLATKLPAIATLLRKVSF